MKNKKLYLVYGESDGWYVYENKKTALKDYRDLEGGYEGARLIEVVISKVLKQEDE